MLEKSASTMAAMLAWIDSASFIFLTAALVGVEITLIAVWAYRVRKMPSWHKQGSVTLLKVIVSIGLIGTVLCVLYFAVGGGAFNVLAAASSGGILIIYAAIAAVIVTMPGSAERPSQRR